MSTSTASWTGTSASSSTASGEAPASPASGAVSYDIQPRVVSADASEVTGMDANQIMGILNGLNAGDVAAAGQAHLELGQTLSHIADRLASNAQTLAQNWQGDAAQAAMNRFQQMHDQTATLAQQATQTGTVLSWLGNEVLPKFQHLPDPRVTSTTAHDEQTGAKLGEKVAGIGGAIAGDTAGAVVGGVEHMLGLGNNGQAQANATAQKYLTALNGHLETAYTHIPKTIGIKTNEDSGGSPAPASVPPGGAGGSGGVTPAAPVSPVSGPGVPGAPGGGAGTHAGAAHSTSGVGSKGTGGSAAGQISPVSSPAGGASGNGGSTGHLQGLTPAPGGGTPPPTGGVPGATGPGPGTGPGSGLPIPGGPFPRGGSGNPDDSELVDESGLGNGADGGVDASPVPEDAALLTGPDADSLPGIDGASGPGMLGAADPATARATDGFVADAPLGAQSGGAAGSSALGADNTGADMAGVPMGGAGAAPQDKERRRQAWMNEDESIWGMPTDHVPPVIEGGG